MYIYHPFCVPSVRLLIALVVGLEGEVSDVIGEGGHEVASGICRVKEVRGEDLLIISETFILRDVYIERGGRGRGM